MIVEVTIEQNKIEISAEETIVEIHEEVYQVEVAGLFPTTIINAGGGSTELEFTAGQVLSAGRAVIMEAGKVYYFDPTDITHVGRVLGITVTSAIINADVLVRYSGALTDIGFAFTADKPVFIGLDGELTTSVPNFTLLQKAGVALSATSILIDLNNTLIKH